jgi:hypothetical protein
MSEIAVVHSKVLVYEADKNHNNKLKLFFKKNNLIGLKAGSYQSIWETLESNIDLGAVCISENMISNAGNSLEAILKIHKIRPELPIFLRRENQKGLKDLPIEVQSACAGAYLAEEIEELEQLVNKYIFNTYYPSSLIRGIEEFSKEALENSFSSMKVSTESPYLIKDSFIYGELFSLIPIESNWCRGYMMLQAEESTFTNIISRGQTSLSKDATDFRSLNNLLSELTNMVWGSFKSRFINNVVIPENQVINQTQVPIIINHKRQYITFGSSNPQLCFCYNLEFPDKELDPVTIYQKFVFHLNWSPDSFLEPNNVMDNLIKAGELELF